MCCYICTFQVDILQDVALSAVAPTVAERGQGQGQGHEPEEEEVVLLRLVGLGMQLHSKSYGARFSFSMQDLDLEVRCSDSCIWGVFVFCLFCLFCLVYSGVFVVCSAPKRTPRVGEE